MALGRFGTILKSGLTRAMAVKIIRRRYLQLLITEERAEERRALREEDHPAGGQPPALTPSPSPPKVPNSARPSSFFD